MFGNNVKRGVMQVIKQRIKAAQDAHDAFVAKRNKEHQQELKALEAQLEVDKTTSLSAQVNSIIGKLK